MTSLTRIAILLAVFTCGAQARARFRKISQFAPQFIPNAHSPHFMDAYGNNFQQRADYSGVQSVPEYNFQQKQQPQQFNELSYDQNRYIYANPSDRGIETQRQNEIMPNLKQTDKLYYVEPTNPETLNKALKPDSEQILTSAQPAFSSRNVRQSLGGVGTTNNINEESYWNTRNRPAAVGELVGKLISNASLIRPNIVDGFSCKGRKYGFYADTLNECAIFHVCYPMRDVFKNDLAVASVPDTTYQFSFICNNFTIFSQDSMTCAWTYEALPCELAPELYDIRNQEFFKTTTAAPASGNTSAP